MHDPRDDADTRTPRTADEHRDRADTLFARARNLPRFGADATRLAMIDEANSLLLQARRLDVEARRLDDLRRVKLWELNRRRAVALGERVEIRPAVAGGPNWKTRRMERAKAGRA